MIAFNEAGEDPIDTDIFLIDDDPDQWYIIRGACEAVDPSLTMTACGDGEAALKLLTSLDKQGAMPKLILLDLHMPKMDGLQFQKRFNRRFPDCTTAVIVLTNDADPRERPQLEAEGVAAIISKADSFSGMIDIVQEVTAYCLDNAERRDLLSGLEVPDLREPVRASN